MPHPSTHVRNIRHRTCIKLLLNAALLPSFLTQIDLRYSSKEQGELSVVVAPVLRFVDVGFNASVKIEVGLGAQRLPSPTQPLLGGGQYVPFWGGSNTSPLLRSPFFPPLLLSHFPLNASVKV